VEKRSESDVLLKILRLKFGDKEYEVPVLRMKQAADWRKLFFEKTQEVNQSLPMNFEEKGVSTAEVSKAISRGLTGALLSFPEKIPELVFSYAKSLSEEQKTEILDSAYDAEFSKAFAQIWGVAFEPFLASLGTVLHLHRSIPMPSASPASTN
jgi:hypothetical protein